MTTAKKKKRKKYYGQPTKVPRFDEYGRRLFMLAYADRYVMCRRFGEAPFVMRVGEWDKLSKERKT